MFPYTFLQKRKHYRIKWKTTDIDKAFEIFKVNLLVNGLKVRNIQAR